MKNAESTEKVVDIADLPDRTVDSGWRAWSTVVGAWLIQFCSVGMPKAFGVTASFYARTFLRSFEPSEINWIGSVQLCMMFVVGLLVGRPFDAGYFYLLTVVGCFFFVFGFFMLSLAQPNQYYQVFLSQGLAMSIGIGMLFMPTSSVVAHHFQNRRGLAMGIITTGGAIGGFVFSTILGQFLSEGSPIGFGWGIRISAFISLFCLCLASLLMRTNYPLSRPEENGGANTSSVRQILRTVKSPRYLLMIAYGVFSSIGLYNPIFSLQIFATEQPGISSRLAPWLLSINALVSILGRLIPNALADRYGVFPVYIPCVAAAGIVALTMFVCTTTPAIVVFSVLYGFFSGTVVSLFFPAILSLDPDSRSTAAGMHLGIVCVPVGLSFLVGSPISAALVGGQGDRKWWAGSVFTGVCELFSAALLLVIYFMRPKRAAM